MKYTRVRIEFKGYEDRLNRAFLVKDNTKAAVTFLSVVAYLKCLKCSLLQLYL